MTIIDEIKKHAAEVELAEARFLDANDRIPKDKRKVVKVCLKFIDGREFVASMKDYKYLENVQFKLRPTQNDS